MKKTIGRISSSTAKTIFALLALAFVASAQRGDLTADELKRASQTVQTRLQKSRQAINSRKLIFGGLRQFQRIADTVFSRSRLA